MIRLERLVVGYLDTNCWIVAPDLPGRQPALIIDPGDRALAVSARIAGGVARAGAAERSRLEALGVRVADTSGRGWSMLRHNLFLSDGEVTLVVRRAMERVGA